MYACDPPRLLGRFRCGFSRGFRAFRATDSV